MGIFASALFWGPVSAAVLAACLFIIHVIRKRRLDKLLDQPADSDQNRVLSTATQLQELRELLADTGYAYDWQQSVFYSILYPWQRRMGYCSLYDESSAAMGMVIDCEPVRFEYGGKKWMIELWKGQYGLTSGAEIGIYNTTRPELDIPGVFNGTFYDCADDEDTLSMTFTLLRKNKILFSRAGRHWWLTGFKLGEFSKPSDLTMEASITFKERGMMTAFLNALMELGYTKDEVKSGGTTVLILYTKPHTKQPLTRRGLIGWFALKEDRKAVGRYRRMTKGLVNIVDILLTLQQKAPSLYRLALNLGKHQDIYKSFEKLQPYLEKD